MNKIAILSALACLSISSSAEAQFDLGQVLQNELRQSAQQFQGQIRGAIQQGIQQGQPFLPPQGGQQQILPYPPVQYHPHPVYQPPRVIQPCPDSNTCPPSSSPGTQPGVIVSPSPQPVVTPVTPVTPTPTTKPVEPQPLPTVVAGQTVSIDGENFGGEPGVVFLKIGETILATEVISWNQTVIEAKLPSLPLVDSVDCLIAVVDAQQSVVERLDVTLVPDETPAEEVNNSDSIDQELPQIEMGTELELAGEAMGEQPGKVELILGELTLQTTIVNWSDSDATVKLPAMELAQPVNGQVRIVQADGEVNSEIEVQFTSAITAATPTQR